VVGDDGNELPAGEVGEIYIKGPKYYTWLLEERRGY
jgi:non-ribosomal peptide synthetase component E (peptide arylation enzyme)